MLINICLKNIVVLQEIINLGCVLFPTNFVREEYLLTRKIVVIGSCLTKKKKIKQKLLEQFKVCVSNKLGAVIWRKRESKKNFEILFTIVRKWID